LRKVLLLYRDHTPKAILSWEEAFGMVHYDRAYTLCYYPGLRINSPGRSFEHPAVIALKHDHVRPKIGPSRINIYCRDAYACQYCGYSPRTATIRRVQHRLTIDHVVPASTAKKGMVYSNYYRKTVGVDSWLNKVTCCHWCNHAKTNTPLEECGLKLKRHPYEPTESEKAKLIFMTMLKLPEEWHPYANVCSERR
jgi:5-methylcytosine-specific restriction endonuclease McrA